MAAQIILGLSILVGVHEMGHLLAAKAFGMRVEEFSIGFPPKIFSFKWGETEYALSLIPLGGFVKISGMMDESLDKDQLAAPPEPWEFRSKPAWQRLIVMLGGIIVNVITGILIFVMLTWMNGSTYYSKDEVNKKGIVALPLGKEVGFKTGDKILKINGKDFEDFSDVYDPEVLISNNSYYTVERDGKVIDLKIPKGFLEQYAEKSKTEGFVTPLSPYDVKEVIKGSGASKGGLEKGDKILSVNGHPTTYFNQLQAVLADNKDKTVSAVIDRGGKEKTLSIPIDKDGKMGFYPNDLLQVSHKDFTFGQSVVVGTDRAVKVVVTNAKGLWKMVTGEVNPASSLSGPIAIAQIYGGTWNWIKFWSITGLLSMVLAFMNLLPIPALDGGHVMFLLYEMISGRKPGDKFMEIAQKTGMIILLSLMAFVILNDVWKLFK